MRGYESFCGAWQAEDDIIPADLLAEQKPNSDRLFFMRMTVEFKALDHSTTRKVKELYAHVNETRGLSTEAWDLIRNGLSEIGSPVSANAEAILQLTCCALQMVKDPANIGRLVLPMELLVCVAEEQEVEVAVVKEA